MEWSACVHGDDSGSRMLGSRTTVAAAQSGGVREVSATERGVIPLQTRLRYTTMVVLPEGEEILDVLCGDRDFWVISATHNIAHVKPAKAGAETNLNLVTSSGDDLLVHAEREVEPAGHQGLRARSRGCGTTGKPKYYSAAQVEALEAQIAEGARRRTSRRAEEARKVGGSGCRVPAAVSHALQFPYGPPKYEKPFLVRSMWHDGEFTYLKTDATELPALYELKDGKPSIVNFQVREGTYVVPKVIDRGYLALGNQRFTFEQRER